MMDAAAGSFTESRHGDGARSSSGRPHIPEPMQFDLIRPLGTRRGELEANVLLQRNLEHGPLKWAPEIEYAFADGLAAELELPMEDSRIAEYKFALQGTLGTMRADTLIHGWQVIGRHDRATGRAGGDALYLLGSEFGGGWSSLSMAGVRYSTAESRAPVGLLNASIFRQLTSAVTLGLETNSEIEAAGSRVRVLPQFHVGLSNEVMLQVGVGAYVAGQPTDTSAVARLIRAW